MEGVVRYHRNHHYLSKAKKKARQSCINKPKKAYEAESGKADNWPDKRSAGGALSSTET